MIGNSKQKPATAAASIKSSVLYEGPSITRESTLAR